MKIGGVEVCPSPEEVLVLPRGEQNIVFRAVPVKDWEPFNKMVPEPVCPVGWVKNEKRLLTDDKDYQKLVEHRRDLMTAYMILESIKPSNIEWDSVIETQPETWLKWEDDLRASGLTNVEINLVINLVFSANQLDEKKLKAARESFLHGQGQE